MERTYKVEFPSSAQILDTLRNDWKKISIKTFVIWWILPTIKFALDGIIYFFNKNIDWYAKSFTDAIIYPPIAFIENPLKHSVIVLGIFSLVLLYHSSE